MYASGQSRLHYLDECRLTRGTLYVGMSGHWRNVPMLARIIRDAPEILFLATGTILVVGITYLF
jgi:hypothetical protein